MESRGAASDAGNNSAMRERRNKAMPSRRAEHARPLKSYVMLINEAIRSVPERRMILADIYAYFLAHYPYFRTTKTGWKNSIRHNLSLSSDFVKVPRDAPLGSKRKGMFWALAEDYGRPSTAGRIPLARTGAPFASPAAEAALLVYAQLAGPRPVLPLAAPERPLVVDPAYISAHPCAMAPAGVPNFLPASQSAPSDATLAANAPRRDVWMVAGSAGSPKAVPAGLPPSPRASAEPNAAQWPLFDSGAGSPVLFSAASGLSI